MTLPPVPNPGSGKALSLGCTCAVIDNARGREEFRPKDEQGRPMWWITAGCPVHAPAAASPGKEPGADD